MPTIGNLGFMLFRGEDGKWVSAPAIRGKDGTTPHIGDNGNWWIGDVDTGVAANNQKNPVSVMVYVKIKDGIKTYTLVIRLENGEELKVELPKMGISMDDVVEFGVGAPSKYESAGNKQFYVDTTTGSLWITDTVSTTYPKNWISIGGNVHTSHGKPSGNIRGGINDICVDIDSGELYLCTGSLVTAGTQWQQIGTVPYDQIAAAVEKYLEENPVGGGVDFTPGNALKMTGGVLDVQTTDKMEEGNELPITSAGVYTVVGNINALLDTI